jgi:phenylacetate-CoA ligase
MRAMVVGLASAFGDELPPGLSAASDCLETLAATHRELWALEDTARSTRSTDAQIADVKRRIDRANAARHRLIDEVDAALMPAVEPGATPFSETLGELCDRLLIVGMKVDEAGRLSGDAGVAESVRQECSARHEHLVQWRAHLRACLADMLRHAAAGTARFPPRAEFKMYNHPGCNPVVRAEQRNGLRGDLVWLEAEQPDENVLVDPVTGAELVFTDLQRAVLVALAPGASSAAVCERIARERGESLDPADVDELVATAKGLALLDDASPSEVVVARQREARRAIARGAMEAKLAAQLERVRAQIPFYRERLAGLELCQTLADLPRVPVLTREELVAAASTPGALVPDAPGTSPIVRRVTSGTSAQRFDLPSESGDRPYAVDLALNVNPRVLQTLADGACRVCSVGSPLFDDELRSIGDSGRPRTRAERQSGNWLKLDAPGNVFTLPEAKLDQMLAEMAEHRPDVLVGGPTYVAALALHARARGETLPRVQFVVAMYELLGGIVRRTIEDAFACPVYDLYGATEYNLVAFQCERGEYHVSDAVVVEVLAGGRRVGPGETGRIVVTAVEKRVAPVVRYDSRDLAVYGSRVCTCSSSHRDTLDSLEGRLRDVVMDADGRPLTSRAVDRVVAAVEGIAFYELVQRSDGVHALAVVSAAGADFTVTRKRATDALEALLGRGARIAVEGVRVLAPEPSGKFRLTRQEKPTGLERFF